MLLGVDWVFVVGRVGELHIAVFVLAPLRIDIRAFFDRCHDAGSPFEAHTRFSTQCYDWPRNVTKVGRGGHTLSGAVTLARIPTFEFSR